jgi:hypothetical protein
MPCTVGSSGAAPTGYGYAAVLYGILSSFTAGCIHAKLEVLVVGVYLEFPWRRLLVLATATNHGHGLWLKAMDGGTGI